MIPIPIARRIHKASSLSSQARLLILGTREEGDATWPAAAGSSGLMSAESLTCPIGGTHSGCDLMWRTLCCWRGWGWDTTVEPSEVEIEDSQHCQYTARTGRGPGLTLYSVVPCASPFPIIHLSVLRYKVDTSKYFAMVPSCGWR